MVYWVLGVKDAVYCDAFEPGRPGLCVGAAYDDYTKALDKFCDYFQG